MRRTSGFVAPFFLALFLAITGCSASGRVQVNNPNHYANHFNNGGQQQTPHNGGGYQSPAYK